MSSAGRRARATLLMGALALSCAEALPPPPQVPEPPALTLRRANLLLRPVLDAEALLGREVHPNHDGTWRIDDERHPGCEVNVQKRAVKGREKKRVAVESLASLGADYASLVGAQASLQRVGSADIDVAATELLEADLRGPCGARVISTVYVGVGEQALYADSSRRVSAKVGVGVLAVGGTSRARAQLGDAIEWSTPSGYAFEYRSFGSERALQIQAHLPHLIVDGDLLEASFTASAPAHLIVFNVDASGRSELLWPSNEEPEPLVTPDAPLSLPSRAERAAGVVYRANLPAAAEGATSEAFLVYAFSNEGDFNMLRPQTYDGREYATYLAQAVGALPAHRFARYTFRYTIEPVGDAARRATVPPPP
jgi:Domain of unknown function (DUF4384)